MDHNVNAAARAAGPDYDEDCPAWAYDRIRELETLARDLYHAARGGPAPDRLPGVRVVRSNPPRGAATYARLGVPTFDAFIGEPSPDGLHHGEHVACQSSEVEAIACTWEQARDWITPEQWTALHGSRLSSELERRACELLDLDPPGFDPTKDGP